MGPLEALTNAIGEELNDLLGFRITRLLVPTTAVATFFTVESTLDWPSSGTVYVDGTVYTYASKTVTTLEGVSYVDNGVTIPNTKAHPIESRVIEYSRTFSAIDQLRGSLSFNTATGTALTSLARDNGVFRPQGLADDASFRTLAQGYAYAPKGTLRTIKEMFDAMFGAANVEVYEDAQREPRKVFVELSGTAGLQTDAIGQTYLGQDEPLLYDDVANALTLSDTPIGAVKSMILEDEIGEFELDDTVYLSDFTETRYDGDPGQDVWTFSGAGAEGVDIVQSATFGGSNLFISGAVLSVVYTHPARILPGSFAYIDADLSFSTPEVAPTNAQLILGIVDGNDRILMGFFGAAAGMIEVYAVTSAGVQIGSALGSWLASDTANFAIRKTGAQMEFLRNGRRFASVSNVAWTSAAGTTFFTVGRPTSGGTGVIVLQNVGFCARTTQDYANINSSGGTTSSGDRARLDTNYGDMSGADVGRRLRVYNATVTNPFGGTNNGDYVVDNVADVDNIDLLGIEQSGGFVQTGLGQLFATTGTDAFRYPDDLGKSLELVSGANAGTVTIAHILDDATNLAINDPGYPTRSGRCVVVGAATGPIGTGTGSASSGNVFGDVTFLAWSPSHVGKLIYVPTADNPENIGVWVITEFLSVAAVRVNSLSLTDVGFVTEQFLDWIMYDAPGFTTETGIPFRVDPFFETDATFDFELSGTSTLAANVLTLRDEPALDYAGAGEAILRATYSMVLSAQLLPNVTFANAYVPLSAPAEYDYYPFYIADSPFGSFEEFIRDLTVAGVLTVAVET